VCNVISPKFIPLKNDLKINKFLSKLSVKKKNAKTRKYGVINPIIEITHSLQLKILKTIKVSQIIIVKYIEGKYIIDDNDNRKLLL
jgi:hypothetical protein